MTLLMALPVATERDVVAARQRARQVADLAGLPRQDVIRVATAVSEIARNALEHGGGGEAEIRLEDLPGGRTLLVEVRDRGPGIPSLDAVWDGSHRSRTGLGVGLVGSRRLMDVFEVDTLPGVGTTVRLGKVIPPGANVRPESLARAPVPPPDPGPSEVRRLDRELLIQLEALHERELELLRLNKELEDTNRGVVALYAELDEQAARLRQAHELKGQLLSYMSHEFRSHLDSILSMAGLLLDHTDGDLTAEQEKQVGFVRRAAAQLLEMVDDLLASARVEAGEARVRPSEFTVADLFDQLRPLLRPILEGAAVELVFEREPDLPPLCTDDVKLAQVLRNLASNALKFTERGSVRVSAARAGDDHVRFAVADTGIGIAEEDLERVFDDFGQVDSPRQRQVRGSGLGLPLTRKLVELLQGRIELESQVGRGSTFSVVLPLVYRAVAAEANA